MQEKIQSVGVHKAVNSIELGLPHNCCKMVWKSIEIILPHLSVLPSLSVSLSLCAIC